MEMELAQELKDLAMGMLAPVKDELQQLKVQMSQLSATLPARSSGPLEPASEPQHPMEFCDVGDSCPTCGHYLAQAKKMHLAAHKKAYDEGRNEVITKLDQAALELGLTEPIEIVAARMTQIEAEEGSPEAQLLIIKGLNGELVGVTP